MALLSTADQDQLRDAFTKMTRPVHLIFFTQTFGCETCAETRRILDELPPLSDKIHIDEVNNVLEPDRAKGYGIDRAPSIVLAYEDASGAMIDTRIRFLGAPSGYEFVSLVHAVLLAGGRESELTETSRARLAAVDRPMTVQVFTTPTCPHCPRAVVLAEEMALANPNITTFAVEATEFPDLARRYRVNGVPKTVVNETVEILGALPEDAFIDQALGHGTIES
jgi:glutaredoxin-like protein